MKAKFFSADGAITGGGLTIKAINVTETAGTPAAAHVRIFDAASATGDPIFSFKLAASGSQFILFGDPGLVCETAVWLEVVAGTVEGNLYF